MHYHDLRSADVGVEVRRIIFTYAYISDSCSEPKDSYEYCQRFHTHMKSFSRKALISLSLEGLGNAVIFPESVGEVGMPCSSSPDGPFVGIHGIPWNFPLQEDGA